MLCSKTYPDNMYFDLEKAKWLDSMEGVPDWPAPREPPGEWFWGRALQQPRRKLVRLGTMACGLVAAGMLAWLSFSVGTAEEKPTPLFLETLAIVLPVFLVIALGYLLRQVGLIDAAFLFQTNRLIYYVALPLLLFYTIGTADFSANFSGALVAGSVLAVAIAFVASYTYAAFRQYEPAARGVFSQGAFRGNIAYVGLAIVLNAYGETGLIRAGMLMGFLVVFLNLCAVLALTLPFRREVADRGAMFWARQIALNPLNVASFMGVLWSFFALPIPTIPERSLKITIGMSLPLALLAIGGSFSLEKLKGDLVRAGFATGIKLVWLPLLTAVLLILLGVRGMDLGIGVLIAGTPAATANYIMAHQMKGDAELAGSIVMMSTALSAPTYTVALLILRSLGPG
jgi:predicted permease